MYMLFSVNTTRRLVVAFVLFFFFFQAEAGIRVLTVTGVQTCALPISVRDAHRRGRRVRRAARDRSDARRRAGRGRKAGPALRAGVLPPARAAVAAQIGRASCRERV